MEVTACLTEGRRNENDGSHPMDRDELRTVQEPLKERYRAQPEAALITLRAEGHLGEGVSCSVATGAALANAGLHPATGGRRRLPLLG
jgi:hypothetical protein